MKRCVVTGGAGFIGSHLARRLIAEGWAVTLFDNLSTGRRENVPDGADLVDGDVSRPEDVDRLCPTDVGAVFHLAAQSSGEISFEDPHADLQTNVAGTVLVLEWCRLNGISRFIYTSSMGAYGVSRQEPIGEDMPCRPQSFYGIGKLASEHYIRLYSGMGIRPTVVRPFNVYGPMQNLANLKQGMASIYMAYLLRGEPIVIKGSLDRFRDQVHVADVVAAMTLCLERPQAVGQTYNIGTGRKITVRELVATMIRISGQSFENYPIKEAPGTPGDLFGTVADISKIRKELGWAPQYDIESGLRDMYGYYSGSASTR